MKQITAQLYEWSRYSPAEQLDHNAFLVLAAGGGPGALVDPVELNPGDREQIDALSGVAAVVLTGPDVRHAAWCQDQFNCPVYAPEAVAGALDLANVRPYGDAAALPGGLTALVFSSPSPGAASSAAAGESSEAVPATLSGAAALFHSPSRAWLAGSLMVGAPAGALSLPPAAASEAGAMAGTPAMTSAAIGTVARALRRLLGFPFERLLVGRGASLYRQAPRALQDLLFQADPRAFLLRQSEARFAAPSSGSAGEPAYGRRGAEYSRLLALETIDFDLQEVLPGRRSTAVHRHDGAEEVFVFLSGQGEVHVQRPGEIDLQRVPVAPGDVVAFPPRYQLAHSFKNTGTEPLRFFAFAAPSPEQVGVVDYPLSGKRFTVTPYGKVARYYLPERRDVPYFENEPAD
jgi:uncharacterized cupin superfamily protein